MYTHVHPSLKGWKLIRFQHFMPELEVSPALQGSNTAWLRPPRKAHPAQRGAEEYWWWESFCPVGNAIAISQCNYEYKTFFLCIEGQGFLPWFAEIWFDLKGATCVALPQRAPGAFCSSRVKLLCPCTIDVKSMTSFSFSVFLAALNFERNWWQMLSSITSPVRVYPALNLKEFLDAFR